MTHPVARLHDASAPKDVTKAGDREHGATEGRNEKTRLHPRHVLEGEASSAYHRVPFRERVIMGNAPRGAQLRWHAALRRENEEGRQHDRRSTPPQGGNSRRTTPTTDGEDVGD